MAAYFGQNSSIPSVLDYLSKGSAASSASTASRKPTTRTTVRPIDEDGEGGDGGGTNPDGTKPDVSIKRCASDADCSKYGPNYRCVNGLCVEPATTGCPPEAKNNGGAYDGCPCGWKFPMPSSGVCPSGYVAVKNADGSYENSTVGDYSGPVCACLKWCGEHGRSGTDCSAGAGGGQPALGEFNWPPEVAAYYKLLAQRGTDYLTNPGYTPNILNAMFGQEFSKVRNLETATRNTVGNTLGREGMLGTGAGNRALVETSWNTEKTIADLMRQIMVENEAKKAADIAAGNDIFTNVTGYNTMAEAINAARRGESRDALAMFMQYVLSLMSGWNQ